MESNIDLKDLKIEYLHFYFDQIIREGLEWHDTEKGLALRDIAGVLLKEKHRLENIQRREKLK